MGRECYTGCHMDSETGLHEEYRDDYQMDLGKKMQDHLEVVGRYSDSLGLRHTCLAEQRLMGEALVGHIAVPRPPCDRDVGEYNKMRIR